METSNRVLTFVKKGYLEWREVPAPRLLAASDAIVRPIVASRCDGDAVFLFHDFSTALAAGAALHVIDPGVTSLGARPFRGPFPYGHECIAEVVEVGESVTTVRPGDVAIVPWAISCGACVSCQRGRTSHCDHRKTPVAAYGFGDPAGGWGGAVSDLLRVPHADAMLVAVPAGIDPVHVASASDNIPDAYRTVAPHLHATPNASVLVVGGSARSIGLYAAAIACAMGASHHPAMAGAQTYSMTSSAPARIDCGTVRPSALAVLRLMTNSNLVGCWTGRSAGFSPLRILPA